MVWKQALVSIFSSQIYKNLFYFRSIYNIEQIQVIMVYWIVALVIWLLGIYVAYDRFIGKWENHSKFERIYFSVLWPLVLPLYLIHYLHNKA